MKYLDTNIIGYAIENHPKYGQACIKILKEIYEGKLKAASSILVLVEIIGVLKKINKELAKSSKPELDIRANVDAILSLPVMWIEIEFFTIKRAAEYHYTIPGADCLHLASMELNNIKEVISADVDFDKAEFVKRIDPLDY